MRWKRLLRPPVWALCLSSLSFAGVAWVLAAGRNDAWYAYPLYVLSAYALTVLCVRLAPAAVGKIRTRRPKASRERLGRDIARDMALNLGCGGVYLATAAAEHSPWVLSNGVYNLLQGMICLVLLCFHRRWKGNGGQGWRGYTIVGWLLLGVNLAMTGCVILVIFAGEAEHYPGVLVFAMAALAFYKLVQSVACLIRCRKRNDPIQGAYCNTEHTEAVMSVFMLQTALLGAFGQDSAQTVLMNTLTGSGVCLMTVLGAVGMICHGRKRQKEYKNGESGSL